MAEETRSELDEEPPPLGLGTSHRKGPFGAISDEDWTDWEWQFRNRITTVEELNRYAPLTAREQAQIKLVALRYPFSVTPYYLSHMNPGDRDDPIRKQAIPAVEEIAWSDMGEEDPLEERRDSVVPGLVHRYPDRVLMVLTDICPMLCRHCTRKREWRHGTWVRSDVEVDRMVDYIARNRAVRDVIISGGDCLSLSTRRLESVLVKLRGISHVEIIRIGSRYPVVLPQRIDDELCEVLSKYGPIWLNTHFNHPNEITPESARACDKLVRAGVPVNNQCVLLKGVNDSVATQLKLCRELLRIKVRPYYLFECDEVQGTEHFRTPVEAGVKIIAGMRGYTSGLAVPAFVIDLPGGGGKVPLQPEYLVSQTEEELILRNYQGRMFRFRNPKTSGRGSHRPVKAVASHPLPFDEMLEKIAAQKANTT